MKKFFTLLFALFIMIYCAKAQYLLREGFESSSLPTGWTIVDADGDGYNWDTDYWYNRSAGNNNSIGVIASASFINYIGALTPDNWLISPQISLTNDATLTFYVAAHNYAEPYTVYLSNTTADTAAFTTILTSGTTNDSTLLYEQVTVDLSAYTGQNVYIAFRHHNSSDNYWLFLDDVEVFAVPASPMIFTTPDNLDFGTTVISNNSYATTTITTYHLTSNVTATTNEPFYVSSDGNNYDTIATIAQTGGTLYVRYSPLTAGNDSATVNLISDTTTATINLTGSAIDCANTPWPYSCSFDNNAIILCWTTIDVDSNGTGSNGEIVFDIANGYASYGYLGTEPADDWLISPNINIPATGGIASFDYRVASSSYPEKFSVYIIADGQTYANATLVVPTQTVTNTSWVTQYLDLSSYAGTTVQVGIKVESEADQLRIYFTNFYAGENDVESSLTLTTDEIDFGVIPVGNMGETNVILHSININEPFTLTTTDPFSISIDGITYTATATIPANPSMSVKDTVFIRFNPTVEGTYNAIVEISYDTQVDTITLSGSAVDCSVGIDSLPYTYDFNTGSYPPICWGYNDASNFLRVIIDEDNNNFGIAFGGVDYLSSPEIHSTSPLSFNFEYATYGGSEAESPSVFRVGHSSTTDNYNDFIWTQPVSVMTSGFSSHTAILPAGTKHVAIEATEIGTVLLYGFFEYPNYLFFDNFSLTEVNDPEIFAAATSINYGAVSVNTSATETVAITGVLLTDDITAVTSTPFEVSADNITFGSTATIPAAGGNLYVRYTPTVVGAHTGNVTLTATGATPVQISLNGNAFDCSAAETLPFVEDFEGELSDCWTFIDADGDGHHWKKVAGSSMSCHSGVGAMASASYDEIALTPDNWLITPAINLSGNATLTYWVVAQDANYAEEHYGVYLSTTGTDISSFTELFQETIDADGGAKTPGTWKQKAINLSAYTGHNVHIAFRHFNCTNMFWLNLDDIEIRLGTGISDMESNTVNVYPNPAHNHINVNATSNISNVEVYTIAGQKVGDFTANGAHTVISTSNLSNGMYLMRINTENGVVNKKFSVAR